MLYEVITKINLLNYKITKLSLSIWAGKFFL